MATKVKIYSDNLYLDLLESSDSDDATIDDWIRYADKQYGMMWQLMVIDGYAIQKLKSI